MTKSKKPSLIVLSLSLGLSVCFLILLTLGLFGIVVPSWIKNGNFNFLVGYIFIALNLILDIIFMIIETKKKLVIPEWFRVVFFIGFFIFTNVYYYFRLFSIVYTEILFYIYLATVLSVLSISIFFHVQKDEKNVAKVNNKYAAVSTFTYATSMFLIIETLITAIKVISSSNLQNGLLLFLINSCITICVNLIFATIFYFSLTKKKKFINACLVHTVKKEETENDETK